MRSATETVCSRICVEPACSTLMFLLHLLQCCLSCKGRSLKWKAVKWQTVKWQQFVFYSKLSLWRFLPFIQIKRTTKSLKNTVWSCHSITQKLDCTSLWAYHLSLYIHLYTFLTNFNAGKSDIWKTTSGKRHLKDNQIFKHCPAELGAYTSSQSNTLESVMPIIFLLNNMDQ